MEFRQAVAERFRAQTCSARHTLGLVPSASNHRSYPEKNLQPGKMSLFCALAEGFIRGERRVQ